MRAMKLLAAALVASGFLVASLGWSEELSPKPIRLLILGPESKAYNKDQLSMLAIQLRKLAERYGQLQVLSESVTDADPLRKKYGCSDATPDCLAEIGKALSADMIMHVEIQKLPGRFLVILTQIDVSAKKVIMQSRQPAGAATAALQEEIQKGWVEIFGSTFRSRLKVVTNVTGAQVALDGRPVGKTPLYLNQEFGKGTHKIEVTMAGYQPIERQIQINASSVIVVELLLQPEVVASLAKPNEFEMPTIDVSKGASAGADKQANIKTPVSEKKPGSGAAAVVLAQPSSVQTKDERFVPVNESAEKPSEQVVRSREVKPFYKQWWFWTAIGAVVVGGTIGAIVGATCCKDEGIPSGKGRVSIEF